MSNRPEMTCGCFPCFGSSNKENSNGGGSVKELSKKDSTKDGSVGQSNHVNRVNSDKSKSRSVSDTKKEPVVPKDKPTANIAAQTFTFSELAAAMKNFRSDCLLGEEGLGVSIRVGWRIQDRLLLSSSSIEMAIDNTLAPGQQNLVAWARPLFRDCKKFPKMADPLLQGLAAMCLQEQTATRPLIGDIVTALMSKADGLDSPGEHAQYSSPSNHRNSPDYRKWNHVREFSDVELGRNETCGGSGRKWGGLYELEQQDSHRGSPLDAARARETPQNRDLDREQAVAEAKVWGENWREKKWANAVGSFDGTND
ncbi:hypothetical protein V6N12_036791 [Hibiscus sabdariffa]|uniref:Uncharacterized protein n=1 Tax=Hibiscus sabdariffa TaxID=183260 RepID=A0ABR2BWE1_9ROSI